MGGIDWGSYAPRLLDGALRTLSFAAVSFLGANLLGIVVALARQSRWLMLRGVACTYTEIIKNTPILTGLFIVYFGLTSANIVLSAFAAGCLNLSLFYAAYIAEIYRGSLVSVGRGQYEGAQAVGLSTAKTLRFIVLPQAAQVALPGLGTMLVDMLKATALLVTISGAELMTIGQAITSETFRALEVYLVLGAIYFAMCFPLSQATAKLERALSSGTPITFRRRRTYRQIVAKLGSDVEQGVRRASTGDWG
ncbi:amino acid ABC transporter permease (plasmid) [Pseudohalocynthiibacter aestuariivivens]|nr:amino acid ABC transporter permease [Pseudohalocynthiibacter aestuariivivens]QIE48012.1 amino acid ABC transporter permease [Pseudohalocynthiibacter aestuariivivens]